MCFIPLTQCSILRQSWPLLNRVLALALAATIQRCLCFAGIQLAKGAVNNNTTLIVGNAMRSTHVIQCLLRLTGHSLPIGVHMLGSLTLAVDKIIDQMSLGRLL